MVRLSEAPLKSPDESAAGSLLVLRDVTQERQMEAALREAHRIDSLGRIAAGVAHDFNNLLTPILGFSDASLRSLPESDRSRPAFRAIADAAERGAALTQQLLAFGRNQILDQRSLALNEIIDDLLPLLRRAIREDISFSLDLAPNLGTIRGDRAQIEQIVMNLAVNASDAMPEGGRLRISTMEQTQDGEQQVVLRVEDSGKGIDRSMQKHIFDPFFTTKERGKGTGLGLATVHGIVEQHGGHIEVSSEPGRGTVFQLYFPRSGEPLEVEQRHPSGPPKGGNESILLVDDDEMVRRFAATVLKEHGYQVKALESGTTALRSINETKDGLDLLITDVIMPSIDGRELCEIFQRRHPHAATVLMTGYAEQTLTREPTSQAEFLRKPFTESELLIYVRKALDKRSGLSAANG